MRETVDKVQKKIDKHRDFSYENFAKKSMQIGILCDYIINWAKAADIAVQLYPKVESYHVEVSSNTKKLYRFSKDSPRKGDSYLQDMVQNWDEGVRKQKAEMHRKHI